MEKITISYIWARNYSDWIILREDLGGKCPFFEGIYIW